MAVEIELYETDDATLATPFDFGTVAPGTTSTVWSIHVWNGNGNGLADEARELQGSCFERLSAAIGWNQDGEATRDGWVEMRLVGQTSGASGQITAWTVVGYGRWLVIDPIPADEARYLEVRVRVPSGAGPFQGEVKVAVDWQRPARMAQLGSYESGAEGMVSGVGDPTYSEILEGLDATPDGTPDNTVQFSDGIWIASGGVYVKLAHAVTFDGNDGDGFALSSGESYWATVSAGSSSTLVVTKSPLEATPPDVANRPLVPSGERLVCYVQRDFDAIINTGDIDQDDRVFGRFYLETSGLGATLSRGQALIDNRRIQLDGTSVLTLGASVTQTIYLNPDGSFEVTTAAAPTQARAEPLWEVTTDGSGETARVDLRTLSALKTQIIVLRFPGTISATDEAYATYVGRRLGRLSFPIPVRAYVSDSGSTSGDNIFDIEVRESASWVTLFTSQGSDDRRPTIAYDSTADEDLTALPEKTTVEPGAMIRAVADAVAGGTPSDGVVVLILEED